METPAQATLVVPPGLDTVEARSFGQVAGVAYRFKQQILLNGDDLAPMKGRDITALWFRRDEFMDLPYPAGSADLEVAIAPAATTPLQPSRVFAANVTQQPVVVFHGVLQLPSNTAPSGTAPWQQPSAVRLSFSTPYHFGGGHLCIEISGDPQSAASFFWPVDYENEAASGTVAYIGRACGQTTAAFVHTASSWGRNLIPGGEFSVTTVGQPGTAGAVMFGVAFPAPVSLDGIGATGCELYLQPMAVLPVSYSSVSAIANASATAMTVIVPADAGLLGGQFRLQAVNVEAAARGSNPAGVTTSNALDLTVAPRLPRGSIATVVSADVPAPAAFPATGGVDIGRGPVIRFEYQ